MVKENGFFIGCMHCDAIELIIIGSLFFIDYQYFVIVFERMNHGFYNVSLIGVTKE